GGGLAGGGCRGLAVEPRRRNGPASPDESGQDHGWTGGPAGCGRGLAYRSGVSAAADDGMIDMMTDVLQSACSPASAIRGRPRSGFVPQILAACPESAAARHRV